MAEILLDPDNLSQGNTAAWNTSNPGQGAAGALVFGTVSGVTCNLTGGLEPVAQFGYFEIRNAVSANNNGLYQVDVVNTASSDYDVTKIAGSIGDLTAVNPDTDAFMLGGDTTTGNTTPGVSINPAATGKSVYFDTFANKIWLLNQGNMTDKGVSLQALYSFTKEEWKNDPYLIQFDFPFTAITPEQFETAQSWRFYDSAIDTTAAYDGVTGRGTRELIRTGGWSEFNENDTTELAQQYAGVITLGTFEDSTNEDFAYVQFGSDPEDIAARDNFVFTGAVNEAIRVYDVAADASTGTDFTFAASTITRSSGSWFTDGFNQGGKVRVVEATEAGNIQTESVEITELTATVLTVSGSPYTISASDTTARIAYDNRSVINLFLRGNTAPSSTSESKTYNSSDLLAIGVTTVANQVYRFPLTNSLDAKVSVNDTDIVASAVNTEYDQIFIRYFASAFSYDVDTVGAPRDFGIVIDAGTHSGVDGATAGASIFTTAAAGIDDPGVGTYNGGTLTIHEGADAGSYTIVSSTDTTVTVAETFGTISNQSFTLQRAARIFDGSGPTIEQIYNRVQYQLRQAANINDTSGGTDIAGNTADELLAFVGDAITAGNLNNPVNNPEGGGTGVAIIGFDVNDTNDVTQIDNVPTIRNFPFLASGSLTFNNNLDNDTDSKFWMFFDRTNRRALTSASIASVSGSSADITCAAGTNSLTDFTQEAVVAGGPSNAQLQVGDYIRISGFANEENNGLWRITAYGSATSITATKADGDLPIAESSVAGVFVDEDPIDSPDAIIVEDDDGNIISGTISATVGFDFDFTNNNQGSRSPSSNSTLFPVPTIGNPAVVVIRAIGLDGSQFVEVDSSITRAAGQSISVVGGQERNYSNPV